MNSVSANQKNRGRIKFFECCFRPNEFDESSIKHRRRKDCSGGPAIVPDQGEDEMVLGKILTSLSEEKSKVSSSDDGGGRGTEERSRRSFSQILKEASVVKKFSRKARKKSFQTKRNVVPEKIKKASTAVKVNPAPIDADSSRWTSPNSSITVSTSTSTSPPRDSSNRADSVESKQVEKQTTTEKARECTSPNTGLCVLLVCLLVLVFLGRVYAVFCTSTFLFLVRRQIKRSGSPFESPVKGVNLPVDDIDSEAYKKRVIPVKGVNLPVDDIDSEAYKKRVIMEGLLERNRSRVAAPS